MPFAVLELAMYVKGQLTLKNITPPIAPEKKLVATGGSVRSRFRTVPLRVLAE